MASFKLKIHSRTVWCLHLYQLAQWLFPFSEHERFVPLSDRGDLILWLCVNWTDSNTASYHHSTTFAFPFINERLHQLFTVENELEIKELQWKKKTLKMWSVWMMWFFIFFFEFAEFCNIRCRVEVLKSPKLMYIFSNKLYSKLKSKH